MNISVRDIQRGCEDPSKAGGAEAGLHLVQMRRPRLQDTYHKSLKRPISYISGPPRKGRKGLSSCLTVDREKKEKKWRS